VVLWSNQKENYPKERQRLEEYFHGTLAPDLMAVAFSIESIHARLEAVGHPTELELRQIEIRISEILTQLRETMLSEGGKANAFPRSKETA
jgi:hypothetical protein